MSGELVVRADGWTLELPACPPTRVNRMDLVLGLLLYAFGGAVVSYYGMVFGLLAGHAAAAVVGAPRTAADGFALLCAAIPALWIAWMALIDVLRRQVRYRVEARPGGIEVAVDRRAGRWVRVPARSLGAVAVPEPWPVAMEGTREQFLLPWTALRGAEVAPERLALQLSGGREVSLWLRGPDLATLEQVPGLVRQGLRTGEPDDVPADLLRLAGRSETES